MAQGRINFQVGFQIDQSGLNQLKSSLAGLQQMTPKDLIGVNATTTQEAVKNLKQVKEAASAVETALQQSFNPKLNTYNIDVFKQKLNESGYTLNSLRNSFVQAGASGVNAFRDLSTAITSVKLPLQETHNLLKSMGTTLMNTIKWSVASTAINTVTSSVEKAWSYTKKLDKSLNNIMVVTEKSSDQMAKFATQANKAAKALGASTTDYTNAALIYYQQGLSDAEVQARTDVTLKAANITKQSADSVSQQLTAVWNGYKVSAQETELYIDKVAAVAAATAADLEELSAGMSKVASAASNMGVDIDQLNGMLATTVSVTREAPEAIGTAFKTIFARMSDIEAGLDTETTLGEYTAKMKEMGFSVLDSNNHLRDMGDVIEEIGSKWTSLSRETQTALAQTMAGTRQYNNLLALFDNWSMYEAAMKTSMNAAGTLQKQQDIYMESIEAHLEQLGNAGERVYQALLDPDSANSLIDVLTEAVDLFANFVESIGGGGNLLMSLVPILTRVFSGTIAESITKFSINLQNSKTNAETLKSALGSLNELSTSGLDTYDNKVKELRKKFIELRSANIITNEEFNNFNSDLDTYVDNISEYEKKLESLSTTEQRYSKLAAIIPASRQITQKVDFQALQNKGTELTYIPKDQALDALKKDDNWNNFQKNIDAVKISLDEAGESTDALRKKLEKLIKKDNLTPQDIKDIEEAYTKVAKAVDLVHGGKGNETFLSGGDKGVLTRQKGALEKKMAELVSSEEVSKKVVEGMLNDLAHVDQKIKMGVKNGRQLAKEVEQDTTTIATGIETLDDKSEQWLVGIQANLDKANLEQKIQKITNAISNLTMALTAIQNLHNLEDIWSNENLTAGEKVLQTVQNLTMSLGMLLPAIQAVTTWWGTQAATTTTATVATMASNAMTKIATKATEEFTDEKQEAAFYSAILNEIIDNSSDELKEEIDALNLDTEAWDENTKAKLKNWLADKTEQKPSVSETGKQIKSKFGEKWNNFKTGFSNAKAPEGSGIKGTFNFKANKAAGTKGAEAAGATNSSAASAGSTLSALMPYLTVAAAAIAAIATTVLIINAVNNKTKKAWEEAREDAERANEAATRAQQSYDNLASSLDALKSSEENFNNLTKGTVEWNKALQETNSQVLELLNTYPELAKYVSRDAETGALTISEEGRKTVQQQALDRVNAANASAMLMNKRADRAEEAYLQKQWLNAKNNDNAQDVATGVTAAGGGAAAGIATGLAVGSGAGTFAGPLGVLVGAAVGAAAAGITVGASEAIQSAEDEKAKEEFLQSEEYDKFMQAYLTHGEEILKSEAALREALDLKDPLDSVYVALLENSEETKALAEAYKRTKAAEYQEFIEIGRALLGEDASIGEQYLAGRRADQVIKNDLEVQTEAVKERLGGGNDADLAAAREWARLRGLDESVIVGAKGANKIQLKINGEEDEMTMQEMYEDIARLELQKQVADSEEEFKTIMAPINQILSEEAENAVIEIADMSKATADFTKISYGALQEFEKLDEADFKRLADELGISVQDLVKKFNDSKDIANEAYEKLWVGNAQAKAFWDSFGVNKDLFNFEESQYITDNFLRLFNNYGEVTATQFAKIFQLAGDMAPEVIASMQGIDWSTVSDPAKSLLELLKNEGIEITAEQSRHFEDLAYILANTTTPLSILQERFVNLQELVKDIADDSIISKEKYEELTEAQQEYFIQMADGTDILTTSATAFIKSLQAEALDTAITDLQKARSAYDEAKRNENTTVMSIISEKSSKKAQLKNYSALYSKLTPVDTERVQLSNSELLQMYDLLAQNNIETETAFSVIEMLKENPSATLGLYTYSDDIEAYTSLIASFMSILGDEIEQLENTNIASLEEKTETAKTIFEQQGIQTALQYSSIADLEQSFNDNVEGMWNGLDKNKILQAYRQSKAALILQTADISGVSMDNLDEIATEIFGDSTKIDEAVKELVQGHRAIENAIKQHEKAISDLEDEYSDLVGKAKLENLGDQIQELTALSKDLEKEFERFQWKASVVIPGAAKSLITNDDFATLGLDISAIESLQFLNVDRSLNQEALEQLENWYLNEANYDAISGNAGAQTAYNNFIETLLGHQNAYQEKAEKIAETTKKTSEKEFEKFELGFQIELDKQQLTKDLKSFWRDFNNYSFIQFKESLQKSLGATQAMFNIELSKFNALSSEQLTLSELIIAKQESLNALQENALTQKEEIAELEEFINSVYSTRIEYQQNIINLTEKQIALNKLVFGEDAYSKFNTLMSNNLAYYSNATTYAKDAAIAAQNEVQNFTGDITSKEYKDLVSKSIEATQAWGDAIEAETNAVISYYESSIDRIFGAIEEAATGSTREDWERQMSWASSTDERWLDEVEVIYQLRDVEREYDKAIEKATGAQKKQLQERKAAELAILEAKKSQSVLQKADVERAQKSLEIEQARMALEDARNNKTKMRLTRGADGTYGYQYVADDNAIREAEDKLEGLYEDLYTFDKERYRDSLDKIAELWAEYAEKRKELGADGELDEEDLAILQGYTQELEKLSSVTGSTLENLKTDIQAAYREGLTEAQMSEMVRANISATSTGIAEFANKILQSGIDGVIGSYEIELSSETQKVADYFDEVEKELDSKREGSFASHLESVQESAQGIVNAFNELAASDSMQDLKDALSDMKTEFDKLAQSIETCINKILKLMDYNALVADSSSIQDAVNKAYNDKGETILNAGFLGTSYMKQEGIIDKDATGAEIMQAFHDNNIVFTDTAGEKHDADMFFTSTNLPTFDKNNADDRYWGETIHLALLPYIDEIRKNKYMQQGLKERMGDYGWNKFIKYANIQELQSGGYTGEWGTDGRLAVLHEKELVLNKDDTSNVLQAVNIIRSIASTLGSLSNNRALQMMSGLSASVAAWELAKEMIIEQKVDITAEFPNATDKDEIMEAFDNLINLASQHAYKTTH